LGNFVRISISVNDVPTYYNAITSFNPSYHSILPVPLFDTYKFTENLSQPLELRGENKQSKSLFTSLEEELVEQIKAGDLSVIFFLFATNAGLALLNNKRIRHAMTLDQLNLASLSDLPHIFQIPNKLPLLMFLLRSKTGCHLIDQYPDLREKITAQGLNAIDQSGTYKGESTLSYLMHIDQGVLLLKKYPALRDKITEQSLNSIEENIENAGATPLLYMMNTDLGYQILKECPDIIEKINEKGLNSICRGGKQTGKSLVSYLCSYEGIQILLDNPSLVKKIHPETLNQIDSEDSFPVMFLIGTKKGCELLIKHPELVEKIEEKSIHAIFASNKYKGQGAAFFTTQNANKVFSVCPAILDKLPPQELNTIIQSSDHPGLSICYILIVNNQELLCQRKHLPKLFQAVTMFNLVQTDQLSITWKCAADFVDVRSELFQLFDNDMQKQIIDYKAKKNMLLFSIFQASSSKLPTNDGPAQTTQKAPERILTH
jgi:hypothetical protein